MRLHFVYRTTGGESAKPRPTFYSKDIALGSFIRAVTATGFDASVTFLVDGPIDELSLGPLRAAGDVVQLTGLGNSGSYRAALSFVLTSPVIADEDLIYLAEDDYIYREDAFAQWLAAARSLDRAAFFTLYDHPDYYRHPAQLKYLSNHHTRSWPVVEVEWRAVRSTTMTFGARVAALRQLAYFHLLGTRRPYPRDYDIWSMTTVPSTRLSTAVRLARAPDFFRAEAGGVPVRRFSAMVARASTNLLVAPRAGLATHAEEDQLAPGTDWEAVAADYHPDSE